MKSPNDVKLMFDEIASKYDFMNNIISFGSHFIIKKIAVKKLKIKDGSVVLDLCCGTGDITKLIAERKEAEAVFGADFSKEMLKIAKKKNSHLKIKYIEADCLNLPFEDNFFDVVTMCFGLRNIEDKKTAIQEIKRVLKNGGQFLHMDFGNGNFVTNFIFDKFTPFFAKIFCGKTLPYNYLVNSKNEFLKPSELKKIMADSGFICHKEYNFLFNMINVQIFKNCN